MRQWVLTLPFELRYLCAYDVEACSAIRRIYIQSIFDWQKRVGKAMGIRYPAPGAVNVMQRFDSALRLNVHFHSIVIDGVYGDGRDPHAELTFARGKHSAALHGFSLYAGPRIDPCSRHRIEKLARSIVRPPIATSRLSLTSSGKVLYKLERPFKDGTHSVLLEPRAFLEPLCALTPRPRRHLMRRVFEQDTLQCPGCGGRRSIIAFIDDPIVVHKILRHLGLEGRLRHEFLPLGPSKDSKSLLTEGQGALYGLCLATLPTRPLSAPEMDSE